MQKSDVVSPLINLIRNIIPNILMGIGFYLVFLIFLPFVAIFFELAWNTIMSYLHLSGNEITYWQALKLSFFLFMAKALLSGTVNLSSRS